MFSVNEEEFTFEVKEWLMTDRIILSLIVDS